MAELDYSGSVEVVTINTETSPSASIEQKFEQFREEMRSESNSRQAEQQSFIKECLAAGFQAIQDSLKIDKPSQPDVTNIPVNPEASGSKKHPGKDKKKHCRKTMTNYGKKFPKWNRNRYEND